MEKWGIYAALALMVVTLLGVLPLAFCGVSPRTSSIRVSEKAADPRPLPKPREAGTLTRVPMKLQGGVYVVPALINGTLTLDFTVDSGASDVSIPSDVIGTLVRSGTVSSDDFAGERIYILANGTKETSRTLRLRSLAVGGRIVTDVLASVSSNKGPLLLGQSFLKRFDTWAVDNAAHVLLLK